MGYKYLLGIFAYSVRTYFALGAGLCLGLLLIAWGLQYGWFGVSLVPCPLCMLQRLVYMGVGFIFFVGSVYPAGRTANRVYAGLALVMSGIGVGLSARHVWLQYFPPEWASCTGDWYAHIARYPLGRVIENALLASGDCSKVDWTLLGLSVAQWSLVWFTLLLGLGVFLVYRLWTRQDMVVSSALS